MKTRQDCSNSPPDSESVIAYVLILVCPVEYKTKTAKVFQFAKSVIIALVHVVAFLIGSAGMPLPVFLDGTRGSRGKRRFVKGNKLREVWCSIYVGRCASMDSACTLPEREFF